MSKAVHWRHRNMFEPHYDWHTQTNQILEITKARCGSEISKSENLVYIDDIGKVTCKSCLKYHKLDLKLLEKVKPHRIYQGLIKGRDWWNCNDSKVYLYISSIKREEDSYNIYSVEYITMYILKKYKHTSLKYEYPFIFQVGSYNPRHFKDWEELTDYQEMISEKELLHMRSYIKLLNGY